MSRLSPEQVEQAQIRAAEFQDALIEKAQRCSDGGSAEGSAFFAALFHLAAELIEGDVDGFCDRAEAAFEEIEAYGQEPSIDTDWLGEVVGDRDTFNFSTDNLVSDLVTLPKRKRRKKKQLSQEEKDRITAQVEAAIIDEKPQDYEQAIAVAHGEDPKDWIIKIIKALKKEKGNAEFWSLKKMTKLSSGELLLGLLIGQENWTIRQQEFYGIVTVEAIV